MRVKRYRGRGLGGRRGKFRWTLWSSSDVVAASTQGYADAGDRDDNLTSVLGGQLRHVDGRLFIVRPTLLLDDGDRFVLRSLIDGTLGVALLAEEAAVINKILADNGEWIEVHDV